LSPFNEEAVKPIYSMSYQNTRIFLELCHDVLEESLESDHCRITLDDVKKILL